MDGDRGGEAEGGEGDSNGPFAEDCGGSVGPLKGGFEEWPFTEGK